MTYRGRVKNGVVVLDNAKVLPEGTEVSIRPVLARPKAANSRKPPSTVRKGLLKLAGKARGLPADASQNVDHVLYGHRKQ